MESDLLIVSADLDGVWDELGSLLLRHRSHIFQQDSDLYREGQIGSVYASVWISWCNTLILRARVYLH